MAKAKTKAKPLTGVTFTNQQAIVDLTRAEARLLVLMVIREKAMAEENLPAILGVTIALNDTVAGLSDAVAEVFAQKLEALHRWAGCGDHCEHKSEMM